jgi:hypothetical protein
MSRSIRGGHVSVKASRRGHQMSGKREEPCVADKQARLRAMIEEAKMDCYSEYEEFARMLAILEDRLEFPFET